MPSSHVLIAEDDRYLASLLRQTLESEGFRVTVAVDGHEALEKVDSHGPDVIILDAMMPVIDGFKVLSVLKADPAHREVPVLMLTGRRAETDVLGAISAGASDYLTKPFRPAQLIQRVRRLVEGARPPTPVTI